MEKEPLFLSLNFKPMSHHANLHKLAIHTGSESLLLQIMFKTTIDSVHNDIFLSYPDTSDILLYN